MQAIQQLFDIIFRKRSVSDLNYDPSIALVGAAVLIASGAFANSLSGAFESPLWITFVQYFINTGLLVGLLFLYQKGNRAVQVLSALYGTTAILQCIAISTQLVPLLGLISVIATLWSFVISVLILKEGLESSGIMALLWTLSVSAATILIMMELSSEYATFISDMIEAMQSAASD